MKFEVIDNRGLDLTRKGYEWAVDLTDCDREVLNDIRSTRGENYADTLCDELYDGFCPICRGDDGKYYTVLFDCGKDVPRPVFWSRVVRIGAPND